MIKAKRVQEIHELLRSPEFAEWYGRFETLEGELRDLRARDPDLLTHVVLRAGEYEDLSHQAENTYAHLDSSFETLSAYEQQRVTTSAAWENLDRTEYQLAVHRQAASEVRARRNANLKPPPSPATKAERTRLETELRAEERLVDEWANQVEQARQRFSRETERRNELWRIVEEAWLTAFRANMARIEYAYLGVRARAEQEALSRDPSAQKNARQNGGVENERLRAERLRAELLSEGEERFECVAIAEFLYWPHHDDMRAALCVPLVDALAHLNIQVFRLRIYRIERAKGLRFIEPLPIEGSKEDEDAARLESFFVGRPT